jgi:hypothetical protein
VRFYRALTSVALLAVAGYLFNFSLTLKELTAPGLKKGVFLEARQKAKRKQSESPRECLREKGGTDGIQKEDPAGG